MTTGHTDVVVAAHNAEATITEAVRSALDQSVPPMRTIVVADACTDATAAAARAAGAEVIEVNVKSAGAARNEGMRVGTAPLIAFLDADDLWRPGWLSAVAEAGGRQPDASFYAGSFDELAMNGDLVRQAPLLFDEDLSIQSLLLDNRLLTSAVVVRRSAIEVVGGFAADLRQGEDWDLWLRLAAYRPGAATVGRHLVYRRSPHGLTRDPREMHSVRDCGLRVLERTLSRGDATEKTIERARANLFKQSAMNYLLQDAVGPARRDLRSALQTTPGDAGLWALSMLSVTSLSTRQRIAHMRQRARTFWYRNFA